MASSFSPARQAPRPQPLPRPEGPGTRAARTLETAPRLSTDVAIRMGELEEAIVQRLRRRPITSVAVALGVGFAVGGALTFRAGRLALLAALRHAAREVLKQVL